jgi:hypothetical protein
MKVRIIFRTRDILHCEKSARLPTSARFLLSSDSMRRLFFVSFITVVAARAWAGNPTVSGDLAILKDGIAQAPSNAPVAVKKAIWAVNNIVRKPYRWGGGHATFFDKGYDCSGTVSFLLHHAGALEAPTPSRGLRRWGEAGLGRWITVYTRPGHAFAVVAGLRLDTTGHHEHEGPRWHLEPRERAGFVARHPKGL